MEGSVTTGTSKVSIVPLPGPEPTHAGASPDSDVELRPVSAPRDLHEAQRSNQMLRARNMLLEAVVAASEQLLMATSLDDAASGVIERLGGALRADRVCLGRVTPPDEHSRIGWMTFHNEWTAEGVARQTDDPALRTFNLEHDADSFARLQRGEALQMLTEATDTPESQQEQAATGARSQFLCPILVDGGIWGAFHVDGCREPRVWNEEEVAMLRLAAASLGAVIKRERLTEQRLLAERQLAEERARMAREIHDTLAQGFTGVVMQLHATEDALESDDVAGASRHVKLALERARLGLAEARRSVYALRPPMMDDGDLESALRTFIARVIGHDRRLQASFHLSGDAGRLHEFAAVELLRIAQEALGNALRHAHARHVDVRLAVSDEGAGVLEIADDGRGIESSEPASASSGGYGLISMRERAARLDGRFELESGLGRGTRIRVACPRFGGPATHP